MNIAFAKWDSICDAEIKKAMQKKGYNVVDFSCQLNNPDADSNYILQLNEFLKKENFDIVFSVNYIPTISRVCNILKLPYVSWVYDEPCLFLLSDTVYYPCNYIFMFDKMQAMEMSQKIPGHAFYLPMCCDVSDCDSITIDANDIERFSCDVSFVGSLYSERNNIRYDAVKDKLTPYSRGFLEAVMAAQQNVHGYNLISDSVPDEIIDQIFSLSGYSFFNGYDEDKRKIICDYFLGYKCSEYDRINVMKTMFSRFDTKLYTNTDISGIKELANSGYVDYKREFPKVSKQSKINLNMTIRTIKSGLPLRIFSILGSKGFLITNFQPEIMELFSPGEDIVYYESMQDLIDKVEFYLNHEDERLRIIENGYNRVKNYHTFDNRIDEMFDDLANV